MITKRPIYIFYQLRNDEFPLLDLIYSFPMSAKIGAIRIEVRVLITKLSSDLSWGSKPTQTFPENVWITIKVNWQADIGQESPGWIVNNSNIVCISPKVQWFPDVAGITIQASVDGGEEHGIHTDVSCNVCERNKISRRVMVDGSSSSPSIAAYLEVEMFLLEISAFLL